MAGDERVEGFICSFRITSSLLRQGDRVGPPIRIGFLHRGSQRRLAIPTFCLDQRQHLPRARAARLELDGLLHRAHGFVIAA
jgi:hypothetical protein